MRVNLAMLAGLLLALHVGCSSPSQSNQDQGAYQALGRQVDDLQQSLRRSEASHRELENKYIDTAIKNAQLEALILKLRWADSEAARLQDYCWSLYLAEAGTSSRFRDALDALAESNEAYAELEAKYQRVLADNKNLKELVEKKGKR